MSENLRRTGQRDRTIIRTFHSGMEAELAGYSTLQWLRAFTMSEHRARIKAAHDYNRSLFEEA